MLAHTAAAQGTIAVDNICGGNIEINYKSIPAALYKCLGGFATNQVNMTKLESFSVKNTFDQANFYLDLEGHLEQAGVKKALEELGFHTETLDILGVYESSKFRQK